MRLRARIERLEERTDNERLVVLADRFGADGELISDRNDLEGRKVVLLEPDADSL